MIRKASITSVVILAAAAAIANARGGRRGAPAIDNIMDVLPDNLRTEVMEDAEKALRAADAALDQEKVGLSFGEAIEAMKAGKRIARLGWNGKGMYLWLLPAATVKAEWCREPHLKAMAEANGGEIEALGSVRMMTADKKVLTGWLASQTDMLCEDWTVLD